MEKFILRVMVIVLLGAGVGVYFMSRSNVMLHLPDQPAQPPAPPPTNPPPAPPSGIPEAPRATPPAPASTVAQYHIDLDRAKALLAAGDAIFIDARPYAEYAEGHIRGAMFLDKGHVATERKVRNYLPGKEVVVYCHGAECTDSEAVVKRLIALNLSIGPFRIIKDGFPAWVERNRADPQGYPIDRGPEVGFE